MTVVIAQTNAECTLANIRTAIQARGYGSDIAGAQNTVINDVYMELCGDQPWDWLEASSTGLSLASGASDVALAGITDLVTVQAVRIFTGTSYYDLQYTAPVELEADLHEDRTTDIPAFWTRRDNTLRFFPRADRAYTLDVRYIKDPPPLVADTDSPLFPQTFCPVLVYGALAELAARTRDWAQADRHRARYDKLVSRMKTRTGVAQQQSALQVQRSGMFDGTATPYGWRP